MVWPNWAAVGYGSTVAGAPKGCTPPCGSIDAMFRSRVMGTPTLFKTGIFRAG